MMWNQWCHSDAKLCNGNGVCVMVMIQLNFSCSEACGGNIENQDVVP